MPESEVYIGKWYKRGHNMLILKGDCGKSRVIDIIRNETNSICFQYYDAPIIQEGVYIDSEKYSLKNFLECISDVLTEEALKDRHYDFLFVYTNEYEEDLIEILDWLYERRWDIPCRDILVTCKETKANIDKVMRQIAREKD